jgi:hypothetical protein
MQPSQQGGHHRPLPAAFVESTVNQVISKRMVNKQQMRWSLAGAQLFLQVRTQVLSNDLTARTSGAGTRASPTGAARSSPRHEPVPSARRRGPRLHLLEADTMVPMPKIDGAAVAAALADRDQLVAFAAMVLSCDPAVTAARMGYDTHGGGISYITATGAAKATGMPIATATRALLALESAGLARCNSEGDAWRPDITALDTLALPT